MILQRRLTSLWMRFWMKRPKMRRHANAKKKRNTDPSCRNWPTNTDARLNNSSRFSRTRKRRKSKRSMIVKSPYSRPNVNKSLLRRGRDKLASMLLKSNVPKSSPSWKQSARRRGSVWQLKRPSGRPQEQIRCSNSKRSKTGIARPQKTSHLP